MDISSFDYHYFVPRNLSKLERIMCKDSVLNHAMFFCGINKWRTTLYVKNSWGKENSNGYIFMTKEWFEEYVYQVVIELEQLDTEDSISAELSPIELDPWDPLGAVASI